MISNACLNSRSLEMTRTQNKINNLEIEIKECLSNDSIKPFIKTITLEKYHYEIYKLYQLDNKERHI